MEEILSNMNWNDELDVLGVVYSLKNVVVLIIYNPDGELVSTAEMEFSEE